MEPPSRDPDRVIKSVDKLHETVVQGFDTTRLLLTRLGLLLDIVLERKENEQRRARAQAADAEGVPPGPTGTVAH